MKFYVLALVAIVGLASAPRIEHLLTESIWGDETFSLNAALLPLPQMLEVLRQDLVHPPLYYVGLKATIAVIGSSLEAIRIPSLIFGLASIAALGWLGFRKPEWRTPTLLTALLVALNSQHIYYSQMVRGYAIYAFLVLALLLWCADLKQPTRSRTYWGFGCLLMVIAVFTHYVAGVYIAAIVAAVFLSDVAAPIKQRVFLLAAVAGILLVPWIAWLIPAYQAKAGLGENLGWMPPPSLYDLKFTFANYLGIPGFPGATTLAAAVGSLLVGVAAMRGRRSPLVLALLFSAVGPPIFLFVLSATSPISFFGERHLVPSLVPWSLLASYGACYLASLAGRFSKPAVIAEAAVLLAFPLLSLPPEQVNAPYDEIAELLATPELIDDPAYTPWAYGIAAPINFHAGSARVEDLLAAQPSALRDALVLYRPADQQEQQAVDDLVTQGCSIADERIIRASSPASSVAIAELRCPAPTVDP